MKKSWNPILNLVSEIKQKYKGNSKIFAEWIEEINEEIYNEFFKPLQVNQHENFILIRYATLFEIPEMWENPDSLYRECRSIVIDLKNMEIVSCPMRKFFNIGQVPETMEDVVARKIENAHSLEISDKLDGSMQHATWYNNRIYLFGSQSLDPNNSWRLAAGYNLLTENHKAMIKSYPNFTFIFEMISPNNPHIVQYRTEGLYLIGVRDKTNGYQYSYHELVIKFSDEYGVPMTSIENKTFQEIMEESKTIQAHEKEGWVINVDGEFIKIKGDDYTFMHRTLDRIAAPNVIIQAIADGNYDDVIAKVPVAYRKNAEKLHKLIMAYVLNTAHEVSTHYKMAAHWDKRSFMIYVNETVPQELKAYVRSIYNGEKINYLKSRNGTYKRLKDMGLEEDYNKIKRGE